jgi:hypothetical protein
MKYVTIIFFSPWSTRRFKFSHSDLFFRDGLTQLYLWEGGNSLLPSPPPPVSLFIWEYITLQLENNVEI